MITVIIPTFNCVNYLKLCIQSLRDSSTTNPKVLVVVDGSADETVPWLQSQGIPFIYRWEAHRPPAQPQGSDRRTLISRCYQNLDTGGTLADTDVLFFGNDDTVFSMNWDERLLPHLDDAELVVNQIVEPGVEVPPWPGIIKYEGAGWNIGNFNMQNWLQFAATQSTNPAVEGFGLNIGLMCRKSTFMQKILPAGGYRFLDDPPDNMWGHFKFKRVCSVPLFHFSGRASRCGGA